MMLSERLLAQGIVPVFERALSDDGREPDAQGGRIPETCFFSDQSDRLVSCFKQEFTAGDAARQQICMRRCSDHLFEHVQKIGTGKMRERKQGVQVQLFPIMQTDVIGGFKDQLCSACVFLLLFHQKQT